MLAALTLLVLSTPQLIAHWSGNGNCVDSVSHRPATAMGGVVYVNGPQGKAFDFDGTSSVVSIPDEPRFAIDDALTISCWVEVKQIARNGSSPQAPIVFRGDDRDGLDPYRLTVGYDGKWAFVITSDQNREAGLQAPATLLEWTHLCATWDGATGRMCLYVNGELADSTVTDVKPLKTLDQKLSPGLAIGNVQNPFGPRHYQPFDGSVADVKIYHGALAKSDYVAPKK